MRDINIYFYTKDTAKADQISKITAGLGLKSTTLSSSDINKTVSELVGMPILNPDMAVSTNIKAPALWALPEIIIFFGVSDEKLDSFLAEYTKSGLEKIKLKAIVTPTNLSWTLYYLAEHIREEANRFG
ncbi:MAG: DUF3783 domain-containing protein [Lachnospiraceae bacterium]|nr:DUF3783 domain-containing protein [Lachnospiraceae bacterium]